MTQDDPYTMKNPIYRAYIHQRNTALRRAIGWRFVFHTWVYWWEQQLGPNWFKMRGRRFGQYVMSRNDDEGPYSPDNVKCLTNTQNTLLIRYFGKPKCLTEDQVRLVLKTNGKVRDVGKQLGICYNTVQKIRKGKAYRWVERNKGDAI